jgi:hypothetical protein
MNNYGQNKIVQKLLTATDIFETATQSCRPFALRMMSSRSRSRLVDDHYLLLLLLLLLLLWLLIHFRIFLLSCQPSNKMPFSICASAN